MSKHKINRLESQYQKKIARINQQVYIRDLVIRDRRSGEFLGRSVSASIESSLPRLCQHIQLICQLANNEHQANYYETHDRIKEGKENYVTRLTMNEFSLYTAIPLSINEFRTLIAYIETMSPPLKSNVHILLSSFAVNGSDGQTYNTSIFLEGGNPALIHPITKSTSSNIDPKFVDTKIFRQKTENLALSKQVEYIFGGAESISTNSIFEVSTLGGASYIQAIDICLDHTAKHSRQLMERIIFSDASTNQLIPIQIEHCVTSASISIQQEALLTMQTLHADSRQEINKKYERNRLSTIAHLGLVLSFDYTQQKYKCSGSPFGHEFTIEVFKERKAGHYVDELKPFIQAHNQRVFNQLLASRQIPLKLEINQSQPSSLPEKKIDLLSTEITQAQGTSCIQMTSEEQVRIFSNNAERELVEWFSNNADNLQIKIFVQNAGIEQVNYFLMCANKKLVHFFAQNAGNKQLSFFLLFANEEQVKEFAHNAGEEQIAYILMLLDEGLNKANLELNEREYSKVSYNCRLIRHSFTAVTNPIDSLNKSNQVIEEPSNLSAQDCETASSKESSSKTMRRS